MSGEGHYGQLMVGGVGGACECRDAVGSMCHRATHRPPPGVCRTRHTCGALDAVCCLVDHCVRVLEIGETVMWIQEEM